MHVLLLDVDYELRSFPFATETPAFLLPVVQRSLLERTMRWLAGHGLRDVHLVTRRNPAEDFDVASAVVEHDLRVAASVRAVLRAAKAAGRLDEPLLILQANLDPLPDLSRLMAEHARTRQVLTFVRGANVFGPGRYTFGPPALALAAPMFARLLLRDDPDRPLAAIARLARSAGMPHGAHEVARQPVEINNSYALYHANLDALTPELLTRSAAADLGLVRRGPRLWVAAEAEIGDVEVDPTGGPVVVGWGAEIGDGAILRGPTVIGDGVSIGRDSCVHRAVLFDSTWLPRQSWVAHAVVSPRLRERVAV